MAVLYKTDADVLDAVIAHFDQPRIGYGYNRKTYSCLYRADGTAASKNRCAVGCLIPDELYNPKWDEYGAYSGSPWGTLSVQDLLKQRKIGRLFSKRVNRLLLAELQENHDSYASEGIPIKEFRKALRAFRAEWLNEQAAA